MNKTNLKKIGTYANERLPLFVGVGLIISIHWAWYRLQQLPSLVDQTEKKELPVYIAAKYMHRRIMESFNSLSKEKSHELTSEVK